MKAYLILAAAIVATVASQLLFKKGVSLWGELEFSLGNVVSLIPRIFQNGYILGGLLLFGSSFILWLFVLSKLNLSLVYPMTSLNFVLILVFSWLFLGERVTLLQLSGLALILLGVFALWKSTL
jgi:multidrug transporter EmrE-like cation transporter